MSDMIDDVIETTVDLIKLRTKYKQLKQKNEELELFHKTNSLEAKVMRDLAAERAVENEELKAKLQDWEDARAMSLTPSHDEIHCGCVPLLKSIIYDKNKSLTLAREDIEWYCKYDCDSSGVCNKDACILIKVIKSIDTESGKQPTK